MWAICTMPISFRKSSTRQGTMVLKGDGKDTFFPGVVCKGQIDMINQFLFYRYMYLWVTIAQHLFLASLVTLSENFPFNRLMFWETPSDRALSSSFVQFGFLLSLLDSIFEVQCSSEADDIFVDISDVINGSNLIYQMVTFVLYI